MNSNKADAWFNVAIKLKNGEKQIGGIPLYLNKELHSFLIENKDELGQAQLVIDVNVMSEDEEKLSFA
tara:strand:+ start:397 stop:600 length:204 start_codon:yes stop_codon:yes gene_type:complete